MPSAIEVLLDSSALLLVIQQEAGQELVRAALAEAGISAVNAVEVISVLSRRLGEDRAAEGFDALRVAVHPFTAAEVGIAQSLLSRHRGKLSLGDAACIATAQLLGIPVLTADRVWATLPLAVEVRLIRP